MKAVPFQVKPMGQWVLSIYDRQQVDEWSWLYLDQRAATYQLGWPNNGTYAGQSGNLHVRLQNHHMDGWIRLTAILHRSKRLNENVRKLIELGLALIHFACSPDLKNMKGEVPLAKATRSDKKLALDFFETLLTYFPSMAKHLFGSEEPETRKLVEQVVGYLRLAWTWKVNRNTNCS